MIARLGWAPGSQARIARALGVARSTVCRDLELFEWETGQPMRFVVTAPAMWSSLQADRAKLDRFNRGIFQPRRPGGDDAA